MEMTCQPTNPTSRAIQQYVRYSCFQPSKCASQLTCEDGGKVEPWLANQHPPTASQPFEYPDQNSDVQTCLQGIHIGTMKAISSTHFNTVNAVALLSGNGIGRPVYNLTTPLNYQMSPAATPQPLQHTRVRKPPP
jgi:hypothetical protein